MDSAAQDTAHQQEDTGTEADEAEGQRQRTKRSILRPWTYPYLLLFLSSHFAPSDSLHEVNVPLMIS